VDQAVSVGFLQAGTCIKGYPYALKLIQHALLSQEAAQAYGHELHGDEALAAPLSLIEYLHKIGVMHP
jgi:hypothetical protein